MYFSPNTGLTSLVVNGFQLICFCVLWCAATFMNMVLLVVFARHSETRTPDNVLLINLCVADLIYLVMVPLQTILRIFHDFGIVGAYSITFFHSFSIALTIVSIVAISTQRYFGISKFRNRSDAGDKSYTKPLLILAVVWIFGAGFAALEITTLSCIHPCEAYMILRGQNTYRLLMYGFVPSVVIIGFYTATSCVVQRSARRIPGVETEALAALRERRKKSASVISLLSISFHLTYLPMFICIYFAPKYSSEYIWLNRLHFALAGVLSVLNPLMNSVVLFRTSTQLRELMRNYMCCASSENAQSNDTVEFHNLENSVELESYEHSRPSVGKV